MININRKTLHFIFLKLFINVLYIINYKLFIRMRDIKKLSQIIIAILKCN